MTVYRNFLQEHVFNRQVHHRTPSARLSHAQLPVLGHAIAGMMAGWTVSFVAAPIEHVKARLQTQYAADKRKRLYSGPIDCSRRIVRHPSSPSSRRARRQDPD